MTAKAAKNIELQGVTDAQRGWENKNGIVSRRRDTIDSIAVNNLTLNQDVENQISKSDKALVWIKRITLILICIVVAGGFSVPIVIYYTEADRGINNPTLAINLSIDNCPAASTNYMQVSNQSSYIVPQSINKYSRMNMQI